jgi:hypothetical protein
METAAASGGEVKATMLTLIGIGIAFILVLVALFAYSSRNKKAPQLPTEKTATDVAMSPERRRATGRGED